MTMITIRHLADHLETIPTLVKWFRAQWPDYFSAMSDEEMYLDFLEDASHDRLPIRLVAFASNELAGTIILRNTNGNLSSEFQPELGGLYVSELHRKQGIGTALIRAGMQVALEQGFEAVFATTVAAAGILGSLGWVFLKTVEYDDGPTDLYRYDFSRG